MFTHSPFRINTDDIFILPVLRWEAAHCQLTPLFTCLKQFPQAYLNGRYERLAISFTDVSIDK